MIDYTNFLPDECLALIFNFLTTTNDRNSSSLVSHSWLRIENQTRTHLTLNARPGLQPFIPSLFTRFNSLTQLVLSNNCTSIGITDNDMILITSMCPYLTRLKLRYCTQLTNLCIADFSKNCKNLKKFSCVNCGFSNIGLAALLGNSSQLEVLSVSWLIVNYPREVVALPSFRAADSLKVVKLRWVNNDQVCVPLIIGSKNLKRLKLIHCYGIWDRSLEMIPDDSCLVEVHLEDVSVTKVGVYLLSKCCDLIALHIEDSRCMDFGLISIAENCKGLQKLLFAPLNWREIGNEGLIVVGKHSLNLQELVLFGVSASYVSLEVIATNCHKLVTLRILYCETITDVEMMCIAEKCVALKILCIENFCISLIRGLRHLHWVVRIWRRLG